MHIKNRFHLLILIFLIACQQSPTPDEKNAPGVQSSEQIVRKDTIPIQSTPNDSSEEEDGSYWFEQNQSIQPAYTNGPVITTIPWQEAEPGLNYTEIEASIHCSIGDSKISVLSIDPNNFELELYCAGEKKEYSKTAQQWVEEEQLIAAFNAGMFQMDGITSVGYLRKGDYRNNTRLNTPYKSLLALNPKTDSLPGARIIDLGCDNWGDWKDRYHSYTQCIRMISCEGRNVWSKQDRFWSMVCVATDFQGDVLFIFTRSPYSVWQFNQMLLKLPLNIDRVMYLEGGPEASFYVEHLALNVQKMGSYETGFNENDDNGVFWDLPNVIGVRRKRDK